MSEQMERWTQELPTKGGFYWMCFYLPPGDVPRMTEVRVLNETVEVKSGVGTFVSVRDWNAWWSGPLEAPSVSEPGNSPATSVSSPDTKRLNWLDGKRYHEFGEYVWRVASRFNVNMTLREAIDECMKASPVSSVERDAQKDLGIPGAANAKHEPTTE